MSNRPSVVVQILLEFLSRERFGVFPEFLVSCFFVVNSDEECRLEGSQCH